MADADTYDHTANRAKRWDEENAVTMGAPDGQRFCQRCGTALDSGRCPRHGADVSTLAAPSAPVTLAIRGPRRYSASLTDSEAPYATAAVVAPAWPQPDPAPAPVATPPPIHNTAWAATPSDTPWQSPPSRREEAPVRRGRSRPPLAIWLLAALAVLLLVALIGDHFYLESSIHSDHQTLGQLDQRLSAQLAAMNALASKVGTLENQSSDPAAVAALVRASVYTIETPDGLGSGWVVNSAAGSSNIITDFHVVDLVWNAPGAHTVQVKQDTKTLTGTITKVDKGDDLAVITVKTTLAALPRSTTDAMVGDTVLVVGSPLGLSGTVANGIVSSFRNGLIQFSAPISPGDSGGPVVNRKGQVIGVAESKLVGSGVEGLSFAIPITTVCTVTTC